MILVDANLEIDPGCDSGSPAMAGVLALGPAPETRRARTGKGQILKGLKNEQKNESHSSSDERAARPTVEGGMPVCEHRPFNIGRRANKIILISIRRSNSLSLQELPPLTTAIYQGATFTLKKYPVTSFLWLLGLVLMFFATGLTVSEEV
jgi:hypothetical protein